MSRDSDEIVEELIRTRAEVDPSGVHRMTAWMGAPSNGRISVVRILLTRGPDRRMRSDSDDTAAKLAEASVRKEIVELIQSWSSA